MDLWWVADPGTSSKCSKHCFRCQIPIRRHMWWRVVIIPINRKVPRAVLCSMWRTRDLDCVCLRKKFTPRQDLPIETRIMQLPVLFFKSAGYKLLFIILSPLSEECMALPLWVLYGIWSQYWRFSLHVKSLWILVGFS